MRRIHPLASLAILTFMQIGASGQNRLIVLDPGHFHAALVQKDMYPGLDSTVSVYAPVGPDALDYLNRIAQFNARKEKPTSWRIEFHGGPDFLDRMLKEKPGNIVILAGRNRQKIDRIEASIDAGLNVLADKPWIISSKDLPRLGRVIDNARNHNLIAYDIMTERFEITSIVQKELVNEPAVFGKLITGTEGEPAVVARSVHHLMKTVSGVPIRRPAWFFDTDEVGESLSDVGTHVVDLVQWTAFPHDEVDYGKDVQVLSGSRWPTMISKSQFAQVTGEADFPESLASHIKEGKLAYDCNNSVHYTVRGAHVMLNILWNWEAPEGSGDVYEASFRGTKSRVEIRQDKTEKFVPELYVVAHSPDVIRALKRKIESMQTQYPGLAVEERPGTVHIKIPDNLRAGHEGHFAQVTNLFFEYLKNPQSLPTWEASNMMVKYFICTRGVEIARGQ